MRRPLLDSEEDTHLKQMETFKIEGMEQYEDKSWINYTIGATVLFTTCNIAFSEVSTMGLQGLLYLSPGSLICGLIFFGYKMIDEYRSNGVCWTDLNFLD